MNSKHVSKTKQNPAPPKFQTRVPVFNFGKFNFSVTLLVCCCAYKDFVQAFLGIKDGKSRKNSLVVRSGANCTALRNALF